MKIEDSKEFVISSLELVELINEYRENEGNRAVLAHPDLLKKIALEFSDEISNGEISLRLITKELEIGSTRYKVYDLNFQQSLIMLMTESKYVRKEIIEVLDKLQKEINRLQLVQQSQLPQTFAEALRLAADTMEKNELLSIEVDKLRPIADIALALTDANKEYGMSEVAKILELTNDEGELIGRNKVMAALRVGKILNPNNEPYQRYMNKKLFTYKTHFVGDVLVNTTYVTGRGLTWLQLNRKKIFNCD